MAEQIIDLTSALYDFVLATERAIAHEKGRLQGSVQSLRDRARELSDGFQRLRTAAAEHASSVTSRIATNLRAMSTELGSHRPSADQIRALWEELGRDYEALVAHIRAARLPVPREVYLGHVKPKNYARNLFHVANGVLGVFCYEVLLNQTGAILISAALLVSFVVLDLMRRGSANFNDKLIGKVFSKIVRPKEAYTIPSATWYAVALFIGVVLLPQHAIEMGVLAMAFGDPAAALAGKRWGTRKLYREKSLVGSLTFFAVAAAVLLGLALVAIPSLSVPRALLIAGVVGLVGALTELFSEPLDDNFTIPLACGVTAMLLL